jgi:ketosteroid isomerase-like protein
MKKTFCILVFVACLWAVAPVRAVSDTDTMRELLALEKQAMDGWLKGDPEPQLAILDPDIIYIHAAVGKRLEGLAAVKELYAQYRGVPLFDSYEILSPRVRVSGDTAVLTYQLAQHRGAATKYWNGTQVYLKKPEGWRIIHTHWSAAADPQP